MTNPRLVDRALGIAALAVLIVACLAVLRPFLSALLLAGILCFSTWPLYLRIEQGTGGRRTLAATLMTLLVTLVLIAPFAVVLATLADNVATLARLGRTLVDEGLPPAPAWLGAIPVLGDGLVTYWNQLATGGIGFLAPLSGLAAPAAEVAFKVGATIGTGLLELALAVFIAFFLYRSGRATANQIKVALERFAGSRTHHLVAVAGATVTSVVYGVLGTALVQGILAGFGFWIADIPAALFLGFVAFVLSLFPAGAPLVWVPVTVWLLAQGALGWGIFMAAWGFFLVSGVDNFLRPWLISRGSPLPMVLVVLGAFGGIIAFGFEGIFLGPTLLAVAFALLREWTALPAGNPGAGALGRREDGGRSPE